MKKIVWLALFCGIAAVCFPQTTGTLDMALINVKTYVEAQLPQNIHQNIQQITAENIASDMKARIDITSLSVFQRSGIEDAELVREMEAVREYALEGIREALTEH